MNKTEFKVLAMATVMLLFGCAYLNAQVTVGTNNAPKATLDVDASVSKTATPAGVIAPRVDRGYLTNNDNYTSDQTGAIVYVDNVSSGAAAGKTENVTAIGYYYFDGAKWQALGGGGNGINIIKNSFTPNSLTSGMFTAQRTILIHYGVAMGSTNFVIPNLQPEDAGKIVTISNMGMDTFVCTATMIDQSTGNPLSLNTLSAPIAMKKGRTIMWVGNAWIELAQ